MVLVGSRSDENKKLFLLLQNWWLRKQFVEVDLEYFEASATPPCTSSKDHRPKSSPNSLPTPATN